MWATALAEPKASVIVAERRRITSKYTDGSEMVEEFDVVTDELLLRKCRTRNALGGLSDWAIEVGAEGRSRNVDKELIVAASGTPELVRQDSKEFYVLRIRNLPYPKDVFSVQVERESNDSVGKLVVRTSNKKYFKRIEIPDLARASIPLEQSQVRFDVKHNTLIIEYRKPLAVLTAEAVAKKERGAMPAKRIEGDQQGCPQQ